MLRWMGRTLGLFATFVAALVVGVIVHLDTARARSLVVHEVNAALAPLFQGRVRLQSLGHLGIGGVRGVDATVEDAAGRPVVVVRGIDVHVATFELVLSLLAHAPEPLTVHVYSASVDDATVVFDRDSRGKLLIADSFQRAHPEAPRPAPGGPARRLRILVDSLSLAHLRAHGALAKGRPLDVSGTLHARLDEGQRRDAIPNAMLDWDGSVGAMATSVRAQLNDERIDAVIDVPPFTARALRELLPSAPLDRGGSVHVELHGPLSDVRARLHVVADAAALDGTASYVGFHTPVSYGRVALTLRRGEVGNVWLPDAALDGTASVRGSKLVRVLADLNVDEPGAPTRLTMQVAPRETTQPVVDFELESSSENIERVPQLAHGARGSYRLSLAGRIDPARRTVDGAIHATAHALSRGSAHIGELTIDARARGALADPFVDAWVRAGDLRAGSRRVDAAGVVATGPARQPHVVVAARSPTLLDLEGSMDVALGPKLTLSSLRFVLEHAGERATVAARRIELGGGKQGDLRIQDARVEGLGDPLLASATISRSAVLVRAKTAGVELARLARLAHLEKNLGAGTLRLDADVHADRHGAEGRALVDLNCAVIGRVHDVNAHVEASILDRHVAARVRARASDVGSIDVEAPDVHLASDETSSPAAWRQAWGNVTFAADLDLRRVMALVPRDSAPLSEAAGHVVVHGHVERDDGRDYTPDVGISVHTQNLVLAPRTPGHYDIDYVWVQPAPRWRLVGIDFDAAAHIDGETGGTQLAVLAHDDRGELADLHTTAPTVPFEQFYRGDGALIDRLLRTSVDARLYVPERGLWWLPPTLQQSFLTGKLQADVRFTGTALAPQIDARALLRGSRFRADVTGAPMDVQVAASYDGERANVSLHGLTSGRDVLDLKALVQAPVAPLLERTRAFDWSADAKAHMTGFPLQSIPMLDDKLIAGEVRGDVTLSGLHHDASVSADFDVDALRMGGVEYRTASVHARGNGSQLDAIVRIDQTDGFLQANAHAGSIWGAELAPTLDPASRLDAALYAKGFRIAAFMPLAQGELDQLDGRLDAGVQVQLDPRTRSARMQGGLALRDAKFQAAAGGGPFHDVSALVTLAPEGVVTLQRMRAYGVSGYFDATGRAQLRGTRLESAAASIVIPDGAPIPLSVSGIDWGDGSGAVDLTATARGDKIDVQVKVPQARVALPQATTAHPQPLGPMKNVRIGAHRGEPARFVTFPLDPEKRENQEQQPPASQLALAVDLGDVHIVRGTQLTADLTGKLKVNPNAGGLAGPEVTGQINLKPGGQLSVQGKTFLIDSGTVTFVDDPSNPQVVVRASYKAPDGTTVYANFVGPLKTGKVTLSSEPPLPRQEIVELLLFGTTSGPQAQTPMGTPATQVLTTVGGEVAQPLNHMFNQLGLGAVTARLASSEAGTAQPEIEVQIANDISVQLAVVLGQPPPGVNPDRTLLTIDWRFASKWSVASTVGDAGTTIIDLLWRRRY